MPIHSTTFDHWQLVKKIRLTFADYIALVYGFSHHIAGTIYKAQEQHVSIALVLFCYLKKFFDFINVLIESANVFRTRREQKKEEYKVLYEKRKKETLSLKEEEEYLRLYKVLSSYGMIAVSYTHLTLPTT